MPRTKAQSSYCKNYKWKETLCLKIMYKRQACIVETENWFKVLESKRLKQFGIKTKQGGEKWWTYNRQNLLAHFQERLGQNLSCIRLDSLESFQGRSEHSPLHLPNSLRTHIIISNSHTKNISKFCKQAPIFINKQLNQNISTKTNDFKTSSRWTYTVSKFTT